jgi:hypothetical protein
MMQTCVAGLIGRTEGKTSGNWWPDLGGPTLEALLRKSLCCLCRLSHRNYLLESPHRFSVADLQQVSTPCSPPLNLRLRSRFLILKKSEK